MSQSLDAFWIQVVFIPAVLGLSAVQEFATRGQGTPLPFDPPRRLVTTGPYSYVANPMQLSTAVTFVLLAIHFRSLMIVAVAAMTVIYSSGLAAWDERDDLVRRFGPAWADYRRAVRNWWPRWRPWVPNPARLYVARCCDPCSELAAWLTRMSPVGLQLIPAEHYPTRDLDRLTYQPAHGEHEEFGIAALARALEHCNLAWAWLGWLIRLPGLRSLLQLLVDASGSGRRRIARSELSRGQTPPPML